MTVPSTLLSPAGSPGDAALASAPGRGRVLVIRGGAIGDFILTLPVLAALREAFPTAPLELLGYPHIAQLALAGGLVEKVSSIEERGLALFFAPRANLPEAFRAYFAGFALVVSYLYDPDDVFRINVARCSRAQFIPGPHRPDEHSALHATESFLKPLERLAIFGASTTPVLSLSKPESSVVGGGSGRPTLAVHPGSGSERKNWSQPKWAELLDHLAAVNSELDLLLIGGEAEADRIEGLSAVWPANRLRLARSLPLADLGRQLERCVFFIGHDSGITHLAAAVGVPALVLWSNTNRAVWAPRGRRVTLLQSEGGLGALEGAEVLSRLTPLLRQELASLSRSE